MARPAGALRVTYIGVYLGQQRVNLIAQFGSLDRGGVLIKSHVRRLAHRIPKEHRPKVRRVLDLAVQSLKVARSGRFPIRAQRVVWLRPEVADTEHVLVARPRRGEFLVQVEKSVISPGTEKAYLRGMPNSSKVFPAGPGYAAAGRVVAVGRGVSGRRPGSLVAGVAPHASHAVVKEAQMVPVPDSIRPEVAAFTRLGVIALYGVRRAKISPGDKVVVIGVGIIGQLSIQLARWAGAVPLVAMARTRTFEEQSIKSGCDDFVEIGSRPEIADGMNADVVIDATGNSDAIHTAYRAARNGGRVVLVGSNWGSTTSDVDFGEWVQSRNVTAVGAHVYGTAKEESGFGKWTQRDESELFLDLVARGYLNLDHLIDGLVDPAQANRIYEELLEDRKPVMGLVFDWSRSGIGDST